jgi:NADH-quinone oxidoreductase subunit L
MILEAAYEHEPWMYWVGVVTAGMTAFYVFRAFFMTFMGEYKGKPAAAAVHGGGHGHDDHGHGGHDAKDDHGHGDSHGHGTPHESPAVMWVPLAILAVLSLIGGWAFNIPKFLEPLFPLHEGEAMPWLTYVSVAFGFGGIALAYLFYVVAPGIPVAIASGLSGLYNLIYNKYFIDEVYDATIISPTIDGSRQLLWRVADMRGIDGIANGIGSVARGIGQILRRGQSGYIRNYAAWVVAGAVLVIVLVGLRGAAQ